MEATMPAVPQHLMQRLHEATERFQQAKQKLDGVELQTPESRAAAAAIRQAQGELDDVTREIDKVLSSAPSA